MGKHHNTLGIAITATPDEIKKAYRKLCMVHHPDKGGNADTFLRVQEAYDSLTSNPVTEPPIIHKSRRESKYNPFMVFYESYLNNRNGDIHLYFTVNDMFMATIYHDGFIYKTWSLIYYQDYKFIIPKKYLIKCNYTFDIEFNPFGSEERSKAHFSFDDPRSKWTKFWDKIF